MNLIIIGAGGHGQVVADIVCQASRLNGNLFQTIGFVDDDGSLHGRTCLGLPVLGLVAELPTIAHQAVIIGIGDNLVRYRIFRQLQAEGERLVTVSHPSAIIAPSVEPGIGTVICAGAIVNVGAQIGANVILNTGCTVDHHNWIGSHVHIGPGAHLGGDVDIGDGVLVGIGAVVMPQCRVGPWSVVGAGAVVTSNVAPYTTVVGVPTRPIVSLRFI